MAQQEPANQGEPRRRRGCRWAARAVLVAGVLAGGWTARGQSGLPPLNERGQVMVHGKAVPYLIRHLPVNSFPQLPEAVQEQLNERGCLIPQTYEAHGPENVVHASLERAGASDWAVLCSAQGTVSLLVFFETGAPVVLKSAAETERLQAYPGSAVLGFNWGIDPASPEQVRAAQSGVTPRLEHDALADSVVDQKTVYRYYTQGAWTTMDAGD